MMGFEPMTWLQFVPSYLIAVAWLLLPGLLVVITGRMRGFFAMAVAPAVSVTIWTVSAVVAQWLGVRFGWAVPVAGLIVAVSIAAGYGWWHDTRFEGARLSFPHAHLGWWLAAALGACIWALILHYVFQRPDHLSQRFDNVWHLNAIRYIVDSGDGSSLTIAHLNGTGGGFYPAGFADLASLVMLGNGGHLTAASNAALMAIATIMLPLSALFFVRSIVRPHPITVVAVGILVAAFPAFPLRILDFGPLHPNFLGLAVLPLALGITAQVARLGLDRWVDPSRAVVLMLAILPGLMLSHPNAFMAFLLITGVMALGVGVRTIRSELTGRARLVRLGGVGAYVAMVVVAWPILRPGTPVDSWPPVYDTPAAVGMAVTNASTVGPASWLVSILMVVGCYAAIRRGIGWLPAAWAVVAYFFVVASSFPADEYRLMLVGIWYNDYHRFAANLPLLALPLAAIGLDHLVTMMRTGLDAVVQRLAGPWRTVALVVATALVASGMYVGTQCTRSMELAQAQASSAYIFDDTSLLITPAEYRLLERAAAIVPADAVIANFPADGSSLAYALTGTKVLLPHFYYSETEARRTVERNLDEAATDPTVCPILRAANVRYVIMLRGSLVPPDQNPAMKGLDELETAAGFKEIAREGSAALYEITACG